MTTGPEPKTSVIAETENFLAWQAEEPDETTYHIDINNATVHFSKKSGMSSWI